MKMFKTTAFLALCAGISTFAFDQDKEFYDLRLEQPAKEYFAQKKSKYAREGTRFIALSLGGLAVTEKLNRLLTPAWYPSGPLCNPSLYLCRAVFALTTLHGIDVLHRYYTSNLDSNLDYPRAKNRSKNR